MSTTRTDNVGDPQEVEQVPGHRWINTSASIPSTTVRVDRTTPRDPSDEEPEGFSGETTTEYTTIIHQPKKSLA
jgi:hypothetical protein